MSYFTSLEFHEKVIDAAESIAPLPDGVVKLTHMAADPTTTVNDISAVVLEDVGLATAILREANSASAASRDPIDTIQGAVVRLGTSRVVSIAVGATVGDTLPDRLHGYGATTTQFWQHAQAAAVVAESVIALSSAEFGGGLVTAALLQNIGSIVLDEYVPSPGYQIAFGANRDQAIAERELIDIDHGAVGAMICRHWQLPEAMCEAIEHHHLVDADASEAAHALYAIDVVVCELVPGVSERGVVRADTDRFRQALDVLGIDDRSALWRHAEQRLESREFPVQALESAPS